MGAIGCKRCGLCCLTADISIDPTMDSEAVFFAMKRTGAVCAFRDHEGLKLKLGPCPHLSFDRMTCLIYEDMPERCKKWPEKPGSCVPGCRYFDDTLPPG